jgi:hypothetical protein
MTVRICLATGLAIAAVVAVALLLRPLRREKRSQPSDTAAAVTQLQQEVERLAGQVRRSEWTAAAAVGAAASAAVHARDTNPLPSSPRVKGPDRALEPLSERDARERLADRFKSEIVDPAWSKEAEKVARQYFSGIGSQESDLGVLECRSKMCRSIIVYRDREAYQVATNRLPDPTVANWPGIISYMPSRADSDGRVEMEEYLFRSGENPLGEIYAEAEAEAEAEAAANGGR